jgi:hypothetical protein
LALNLGACLDPIEFKPILSRRTPSELAGSALKGREPHECAIWQELEETSKPIACCDWHEPGMKLTIWRLNRDRRFDKTGCDDRGTPDRPATQQVLRPGAYVVFFVVVGHG